MRTGNHTVEFTTDHAASSYGLPVLVIDGDAFGAADETPLELAGRSDGSGIVRYFVEEGLIPFRDAVEAGYLPQE